MNKNYLNEDWKQLDSLLELVKQQSQNYLTQLSRRPTSSDIQTPAYHKLPKTGNGASATLSLFNQRFESLIVGSSGPRLSKYPSC